MGNNFTRAVTRKPGKNFARGITTANLGRPSYELILQQHETYVETLISIGLDVIVLDSQPDFPDAHFVEDTAVVTSDLAVITNPGAETRKGEEESIAMLLSQYRKTARIQKPGTMDGGDVLMVGTHFIIGISVRTNLEGARQLGRLVENSGYTWTTVPVGAGLHLKSGVNYIGNHTLIVAEEFAHRRQIKAFDKIMINSTETYAANTLWVNDRLLMPRGFPDTRKKLESRGLEIIELDMSEARKMDGGLTCWSIRF